MHRKLDEDLQPVTDKRARLLALARRRQNATWPRERGYKCIGDYHQGAYECDFVSPYTRGACNVDAEVMILIQDWAADDVLSGTYLHARAIVGHDPTRGTNKRLQKLLHEHFGLESKDVYATNVFPFIKVGRMNASIPTRDLVRAAREFALPQMEIIEPRIAVCLGKAAFDAVAVAAGRDRSNSIADAVKVRSPFGIGNTQVWCQAHTGQHGTNHRNRNGLDQVGKDWARMAAVCHGRVKQVEAPTVSGKIRPSPVPI
jgi:uracil-DNA glycosylase